MGKNELLKTISKIEILTIIGSIDALREGQLIIYDDINLFLTLIRNW